MDVFKKIFLMYLNFKITLLRFKTFKVEMSKSDFVIYTIFILLIGLGLGMVWRANQIELILKKRVATLEQSGSERMRPFIKLEKTQNAYPYLYPLWGKFYPKDHNLSVIELPGGPIREQDQF